MKRGNESGVTTLNCHACVYASPLPPPFEDWIWCGYPGNGQPLNLGRDADCRHPGGGRLRDPNAAPASASGRGATA